MNKITKISLTTFLSALLISCIRTEKTSEPINEGYRSIVSYVIGEEYNYISSDALLLCIIVVLAVDFICWCDYIRRKRKEYKHITGTHPTSNSTKYDRFKSQ